MSTITAPARVLSCQLSSSSLYVVGGVTSDITYSITISNILPQVYLNSNKSSYLQYTGLDVSVGDWVSSGPYGRAYQITSILSSTTTTVSCLITDINGYILSTFGNNFPIGGKSYVFQINEDGFPILSSPSSIDAQDLIAKSWQVDLISHFMSRNLKTQYVSVHQSGHGLSLGDPIYIDGSGNYQKSVGSVNMTNTIGIVTQVNIPDSTWFSYRPLGHYFDNSYLNQAFVPTGFTGGNILYINPTGSTGGNYVTTKNSSTSIPLWQMLTSNSGILLGVAGPHGPSFTTLYSVPK